MSMITLLLPCKATHEKHMSMNTSTVKKYIIIAREFQKHPLDRSHKNGVMDQGNDQKWNSKQNQTECDYHFQYIKDVSHTTVNISCSTTQLSEFSFCGPHQKPHGVRGLIKHYNIRLDPKLGHVKCAIKRKPCACVSCINMLYTPWDPGLTHTQKTRYKPVVDCT